MARRCFEVKKLDITFWFAKRDSSIPQKVSDELEKYLKKYASTVKYNLSCKEGYNLDAFSCIKLELSKTISISTMINIITHLFIDNSKYNGFSYNSKQKQIDVVIIE